MNLRTRLKLAVLVLIPLAGASAQPVAGTSPTTNQFMPAESPQMTKMAESMTAMAQMCQTMMQHEDRSMHSMMIGAWSLGSLVVIALILFIVLEIQWIRFFAARIQTERKKLP